MADIAVAITSESVLDLKRSTKIIIDAYKRYAGSILTDDENGVYPLLLEETKGLGQDLQAGIDSLGNYDVISLDDVERPAQPFGQLNSYRELDKIEGNYPISQSVFDEASDEVKKIFNGLRDREAPTVEEGQGSNFSQNGLISESSDGSGSSKPRTSNTAKSETINSGDTSPETRKVLGQTALAGLNAQPLTSGQTGTHRNKARGKFGNSLLEDCIPCDLRLHNADEFFTDLKSLDPFEELRRRYEELKRQFESLLNNTEIIEDICNLLNFLDFQCMPDLYGIIALLTALMRKYSARMPNLSGAFMQFIGPFFSPMLSGLNELLDKYIQMILKPVDCVVNSLDTQLAKLDVQRALNQNDVQEIAFHRRREGFLRRKIESLEERKSFLSDQINNGADPNRTPPQKIGGRPRSSQSNLLRDVIDSDPSSPQGFSAEVTFPDTNLTTTINEEISNIDDDLASLREEYRKEYGPSGENNITQLLRDSRAPNPTVIGNTRGSLRDARRGLASGLYELRDQILNGKHMVNDTVRLMREELTRLILGRAATSEEMLEGARDIQRIARLIGIVRSLSQLKAIANNPKLCENSNGDPSVALGSFLTSNRGTQPTNNYYNVYVGDNEDGERSLLVAPSDAVLELADPESDSVRQLDNLDEINKLNNDGIPQNLGDITNKKVTATVPELGVQVPVRILTFDLCKNSNFSTEADIENIRQWASDAGLSA